MRDEKVVLAGRQVCLKYDISIFACNMILASLGSSPVILQGNQSQGLRYLTCKYAES